MPGRSLDRIDGDIIQHLQKNARMSNKDLAHAVGVAPSTCLDRVRKLTDEGVITGYHAAVQAQSVGVKVQALVAVQLHQHARPRVEAFQEHAMELPEVVQLFHTTGSYDFLVHVATRSTNHLRELALSAFTERAEVARIETSLLFTHQQSNGLPLLTDRT